MKKEYFGKEVLSATECANQIEDGDIIWLSPVNGAPNKLVKEITNRAKELINVHIWSALQLRLFDFMKPGMEKHIKYHTLFMGPLERKLNTLGAIDVHSVNFEYLGDMFSENIKASVLVAEVSEPDENGVVCFGPAGGTVNSLPLKTATKVILQVNPKVPFIYGENNSMNIMNADYICYSEEDLVEIPEGKPNAIEEKIAELVIDEIEDNSVIQLGLGGLSESIGYGLIHRKDLGIHTEMFTQSMKYLSINGAVTNAHKNVNKGVSVIGFGLGNKEFYEYLHENKNIKQLPINEVNHPLNIMQNDQMVSINSCVSIDLSGQISSEGIGARQISGTGGALDYVKGANFAKKGKSFIVLESSKVNKVGVRVSNILGDLPEGTPITIPRSEVDYVGTEYGLVHLKNLTLRERAIALINIAHPEFRKDLANSAISKGLLKGDDLSAIKFEPAITEIKGNKVLYQVENGICTLTMNDPKTMNALGAEMMKELLSFITKADKDSNVKVIVLTGAGGTFSSGGNIKEMLAANNPVSLDEYANSATRGVGDISLAIRNVLKPVIAKIEGSAAGAGMNIALACDYRIVSDSSKYVQAFVNIGLLPDAAGISLLTSLVGPSKAMEMISLGETITAQEAEELGLVTLVVADEGLEEEVAQFATRLNKLPAQALRQMKHLINQETYSQLQVAINREVEGQRTLAQTKDVSEGISAFIQKREPFFQGK